MSLLCKIEHKGTNEKYSRVREILILALFFFFSKAECFISHYGERVDATLIGIFWKQFGTILQ